MDWTILGYGLAITGGVAGLIVLRRRKPLKADPYHYNVQYRLGDAHEEEHEMAYKGEAQEGPLDGENIRRKSDEDILVPETAAYYGGIYHFIATDDTKEDDADVLGVWLWIEYEQEPAEEESVF